MGIEREGNPLTRVVDSIVVMVITPTNFVVRLPCESPHGKTRANALCADSEVQSSPPGTS